MASESQFEIAHVLFMDVVGYSKMLIDDQREVIHGLKEIVRASSQFQSADAQGKLISLPTGDGMVLAFFTTPDAPVRCAVEVARALKTRLRIPVRMGVHSGPVSGVADVNQRSNLAGAGINIAQRVMDCGDAGHILVSRRVAEDLTHFREWSESLHDLGECEVKHGLKLQIFNFYSGEFGNALMPTTIQRDRPVVSAKPGVLRRRPLIAAFSLLVLLVLAVAIWRNGVIRRLRAHSYSVSDRSIAVLPFVDLSQAKDQEYFCDGISEELLDGLAKIPGLRVVARTSSFSFKGKGAAVAEIADKLGVATVLEGSLRREGNRIRVTAQLINAKDGFHLWSETFERELKSVFAVQDEITRAIVDSLRLQLGSAAPHARKPQNSEAYDLYLQGLYFSNKSTEEGLRKSLELFQQSLERDPSSARAWAGIAKAWTWLADAYVRPKDAYPAVRSAALKAIELDEQEPDGHIYLSEVMRVLDWDIPGSERELRRALELDPNSATAHCFFGLISAVQGRTDEAAEHARLSVKADPLSPIMSNFAALGYAYTGHFDEAVVEAKRTEMIDPGYMYESPVLADIYLEKGMLTEAVALYTKAQKTTGALQSGLAVAYARTGRENEARQLLAELEKVAATKYLPPEEIASVYAALGEPDEAFRWLDRACEEHSGPIHAIAVRPVFRPLHGDPRFAAVLRRIGIDPAKVLHAPAKPAEGAQLPNSLK